jgi:aminomethyltransferase
MSVSLSNPCREAPNNVTSSEQSLLHTPLRQNHIDLGARMVPFGGWEMPLTYGGQIAEHEAVRTGVGIFDVSHMGQVRFTGAGAGDFLQWLTPGDITSLEPGQSRYTQLVRPDGGTIDDLIISRLSNKEYFAVVNASRRVADVRWMRENAGKAPFSVNINDESNAWVMIAVQGPKALALLNELIPGKDWAATPAFSMHYARIEGHHHFISRTGYTGEIGAEILQPAVLGDYWWTRLLKAGAVPCGLAARDSLRLEAGYCLYGHELSETITPVEAGVGWSVSLRKPEVFLGRTALEIQKANGAPRRLVGLRGEGRRPLRDGEEVAIAGGEVVGKITSGGFSPGLQCGIALALIASDAPKEGLVVRVRDRETPVTIKRPPFVETSITRAKA